MRQNGTHEPGSYGEFTTSTLHVCTSNQELRAPPQLVAIRAPYRRTQRHSDTTISLFAGIPEVVVLAPPLRISCPQRLTGWTMYVCWRCVPVVEEARRSQGHPENSPAIEPKMRSAWWWRLAYLISLGEGCGGPLFGIFVFFVLSSLVS